MSPQFSGAEREPLSAAAKSTAGTHPIAARRRAPVLLAAIVVSLILLGFAWFTTATWVHFSGAAGLRWTVLPAALAVCFVPVALAGFSWDHPPLRAAYMLTATALGFLNFAAAAAIACWIVLGLARLTGLPIDRRLISRALYGGAILTTILGLINAARIRITRVTVRLPGLPEAWHGREVALVSDLHVGNVRGPGFVRRVVSRLQFLEPSAVFIAGDIFDGGKVDLEPSVRPWAGLRPPAGAYFVSGNHDEFGERTPYLDALKRAGLRVLDNEKVTVDGLQIVGVHDGETRDPRLFAEILNRAKIDPNHASILLAHRPENLDVPEKAGVSLQFSGHTHAGQFWPWNWMVSKIYGRFALGLSRHGNLQVFTSSGVGTWGPPLRVGTRAEIVVLRLISGSSLGPGLRRGPSS